MMSMLGCRAVVIGASISGLLAARVLADATRPSPIGLGCIVLPAMSTKPEQ